jgi:TolB-like protein
VFRAAAAQRFYQPATLCAARAIRFVADVDTGETARALPVAVPNEGGKRIESLAVLPLENLSGDASQDYFADAMTDELITELTKFSALRVISRTSAMQYKGARKPLPEIARELNVDAVIEGSALRVSEGRSATGRAAP